MTDSYGYHRRKFQGAKYVSFDRAYGDLPLLDLDPQILENLKSDPDYKLMME